MINQVVSRRLCGGGGGCLGIAIMLLGRCYG